MMLGGIWWITHRREEVAETEGHKPKLVKSESDERPS